MVRPQVFLDIKIDDCPPTRVTIELFNDTAPKAAELFRIHCTGEKGINKFGRALHYKGCSISRIIKGLYLCGGPTVSQKEIEYTCMNGDVWEDEFHPENYINEQYIVIMGHAASFAHDKLATSPKFAITLTPHKLSCYNDIIVGKVIDGFETMITLNGKGDGAKPNMEPGQRHNYSEGLTTAEVIIADCGELVIDHKPKVFLDIQVGENTPKRLVIELFYDHVPKTAENFRALCTGEKGNSENGTLLQYTGCFLDMIFPDYIIQGGDITHGRGNESIYGDKFDDENFLARHTGAGILSMANSGPNTNGSQFMISVVENTLLDGKHVVFGRVVEGMDFLMELNSLGTESGKPTAQCYIADSGQL